jgi:hypothetical protein
LVDCRARGGGKGKHIVDVLSKRASLASVITPGSPTKNPYSAVASNLSKAFKGASFAGIKSTGARNVAL